MNYFQEIWDELPVTLKYWIVIQAILLLLLGVFVLAFEPGDADAATLSENQKQAAHDACSDAKALGEFRSVDWSIAECERDAIAYLEALKKKPLNK
jgi:hypothetical protein